MVDVVSDKVVLELDARTARYLGNIRASRSQFDREMNAMGLSASRMEKQVVASGQRMAIGLNSAIAAIAVGAAAREAQLLADTWTQTGNKLSAAGVQTTELAARQRQLLEVAQQTRSEYGQTADIYARVTRSTQELNATDYQRLRVTELINKATKAGGATTAEQISTITQLGQALASGNLQGDELRSLRENAPLIARAIATEFETTVGGLKKLGAEGELTSDRVFSAILKYGPAIDAQFSTTRATIGESFTYLQNEATEFLGNFDKAVGVTTGIAEFTQKVANDFDLMAQAVIVSAALVGGALVGRMTVPLQQAAVSNAKFVASLMNGRSAFQLEAEAARANARQILLKAQQDRDASRASVVATQERINQLRQEAAAYQTNINLATQQRSAVAGIAAGRSAGGQFVSRGDQATATAARDQATKALIANRRALQVTTDALTAAEARLASQHNILSGALVRVAGAQTAVNRAMSASVVVARTASIAMQGLGLAMGFFGGPVGIAIMAVAGALAYFSTEAAKAEAAGDNLRATLEETEQAASSTAREVESLSDGQRDGASASNTAANAASGSATAYDAVAASAANAAEQVKYLTAVQRQQRLKTLEEQINESRRAQEGNNVFTTNNRERVANLRADFVRLAGFDERADRYDRTGQIARRAATAATAPGADPEVREAYNRYVLAVRAFNQQNEDIDRAVAERAVLLENANAPTLERPSPTTSNITPPTVNSGDNGSSPGGRRGRTQREETREELEARRDIAELERRLILQREAGAESLAQFTEDEIARRRLIAELIDQQYSPEQAEDLAKAYIEELRAAREVSAQAERDAETRDRLEKQREQDEEARIERAQQVAYLQEQELLLQRELARLAGNSERVRELDLIIERMRTVRDLVERGGMSQAAAKDLVTRNEEQLDQAEIAGDIKDTVLPPIREALLEAFRGGDWSQAFADAIEEKTAEGLSNGLDLIYDYLASKIASLFSSAMGGGKGGGIDWGSLLGDIGSFFGFGGVGKKAAGGANFRAGEIIEVGENGRERVVFDRAGRVLPNRVESSAGSSGAVNVGLTVVNATGVPAKASMEKDDQGNMKVRLEPLIDEGILSAGRRGVVAKAQKSTPSPKRRV